MARESPNGSQPINNSSYIFWLTIWWYLMVYIRLLITGILATYGFHQPFVFNKVYPESLERVTRHPSFTAITVYWYHISTHSKLLSPFKAVSQCYIQQISIKVENNPRLKYSPSLYVGGIMLITIYLVTTYKIHWHSRTDVGKPTG